MARTRYMQVLWQPQGGVLTAKTGSPWEVRLRGTGTPATFWTAETGGTSFAATDANLTTRNGRVEPEATVGGELWIDETVKYDEYTTADGGAVSGGNPLVKVGAGGGGGGGGDFSDALGVIDHGNTAGTARGSKYAKYLWTGAAEPTNASNGDFWVPRPA